jgi:hypothetical protein
VRKRLEGLKIKCRNLKTNKLTQIRILISQKYEIAIDKTIKVRIRRKNITVRSIIKLIKSNGIQFRYC